jgi:hypothetical protein
MNKPVVCKRRCAIYTRKSTEEGLDQQFNSLDAQREACEAYMASQKAEGWTLVPDHYDDGGFSGATLERPALKRLSRPAALLRDAGVQWRERAPPSNLAASRRSKQGAIDRRVRFADSLNECVASSLSAFELFTRFETAHRCKESFAAGFNSSTPIAQASEP